MRIKSLLGHSIIWLAVASSFTILLTAASLYKFILSPFDVDLDNGDKVLHFVAYAILALVWFFCAFFSTKIKYTYTKILALVAIFCAFYGVLMEVAQGFLTTYRTMDYKDALANTSGIVFVVIILIISKQSVLKWKNSKR
ncbi:VanZ family protein [Aquimarina brevivitae]|uniref:VanZ like protein n=1 Tax=Aquimarina brevivitae TaxID=323412 RepID=A0A4Q7PGI3_9FLAO|nr:VanZ family protein [Aquimarina brevivitae]RZS98860.1 VanZ like protein [Aquimarina brevivitae]